MVWQRKRAPLMTHWSEAVQPESVWPEYPRPQLVRSPETWLNLNGLWEFTITRREQPLPGTFQGHILLPFPIESALSGVMRSLEPDEWLWYHRTFTLPDAWEGRRILLHFGAVDWETSVWLNGSLVGVHRGGYVPFSFDLTPYLRRGEQDLLVRVWDPTDTYWQQRGKQVRQPRAFWYQRVSGIWQTVWLEAVPQDYLASLRILPDVDGQRVCLYPTWVGKQPQVVKIRVLAQQSLVSEAHFTTEQREWVLAVPQPRLWSPETPFLYDLEVEAGEDRVRSYFGMRKFGLGKDAKGRTRVLLNDQPIFMYGPLDQGYWPDGLYTPPSEDAMRWELRFIKDLGCNMVRKHIKVELARYYYACDQMGLIVWQDMVSGGRAVNDWLGMVLWLAFGVRRRDDRALWRFGRAEVESREDFRRELREMVDSLFNVVSIGVWVLFNEGWGQFEARAIAEWLKAYDPTRLVDHASGWYDQGGGDLLSLHQYVRRLKPQQPEEGRAVVLSEFGGYAFPVCGHMWEVGRGFGYRWFKTSQDLTAAYERLIDEQLIPWVRQGLSAAVYTQTCDVEREMNGYLTYDRAIIKMDVERVRAAHQRLMAAAGESNRS